MPPARLALLLGFGLAISLALSLPVTRGPRAPQSTLTPCASTEGLLCGFVSVPLDYAQPKARKLRLFVTAHRRAQRRREAAFAQPAYPRY